jgi:hypothetical protein
MSPDTPEKQDKIKEEEWSIAEDKVKPVKKTTRRRRSTKKAPKEVEPEPEAEPDIQLTVETKDGEVIEVEGVIEERPDSAEPGEWVGSTEVILSEIESTGVEPVELEPAVEIPWIPPKRVIVKNVGGGPAVVGTKTLLPGEVGPCTWPQFLAAADTHRGWLHWSEVGDINFRSEFPA